MLKYVISFASGFVIAKIVTKSNVKQFKDAALKSYVVIKDELTGKKNQEEAI